MKYCPQCGMGNENSNLFCRGCGHNFEPAVDHELTNGTPSRPEGYSAQPSYTPYRPEGYNTPNYTPVTTSAPQYDPYGEEAFEELDEFNATVAVEKSGLDTVIKVFMVISCIAMGLYLIPLVWCIPMTVSVWKALNEGRPVSIAMKICVLLFVNTIAGICLLCRKDS